MPPSPLLPDEQRAHDRAMRIVRELVWLQRYVVVFGVSIVFLLLLVLGTQFVTAHNPQPVTVTNIPLVVPLSSYPAYPAPAP